MSDFDIEIQERILRLWSKMFTTAVLAVCNSNMAKDIVQDTIVEVWNSREKLREVKDIDGYIFGILFNTIADEGRKKVVNVPLSDVDETFLVYTSDDDHDRKIMIELLDEGVNAIAEDKKNIIDLYYKLGLSAKMVGDIVGLSESGVRKILKKIHEELREYIDNNLKNIE
ncbi:MAG: sigma-70 family RNA polymerase sigma factor [Bacteroidales bacterium]|nr:sigma-70 family RNA polymerase sigma factor [Bacteroidales bacterium]